MKIKGYPVIFDAEFPRLAEARGVWPWKRIVVGRQWYALQDHERKACLLHEVGHCERWHMEKRLLALPIFFILPALVRKLARAQEIEADAYAAREGYGHAMIAVVKRFQERSSIYYPSHEERLHALAHETARWTSSQVFKGA